MSIYETENNRENLKIEMIEKENIKMLILYRSLYTLKHKFENHRTQIYQIYSSYNKNYKTVIPISLEFFKEIMNQLMSSCCFCVLPYTKYMELLTPDLLTKANRQKSSQVITLLERFIKQNLSKYNSVFHEKRMKEKQKRIEEEQKINIALKDEEITKEIIRYDKRGKVIYTSEEMISNNKELKLYKTAYKYEEDDIDVLFDSKYFYAEMLPIAFADFLQSVDQIALVDTNEELKEELKALFDHEIMQQLTLLSQKDPKEEKNMKLKNILFEEMNVNKMLKYYQNSLMVKSSKGENTRYIEKMINQLREQKKLMTLTIQKIQSEYDMINRNNTNALNNSNENLTQGYNEAMLHTVGNNSNDYNNRINSSIISKTNLNVSKIAPKSMPTKDEQRKNALTEIFYFYSRQHLLVGTTPTFDSLKNNESNINLSEFIKFCVEFKIMIKKMKLIELFKKTASNSRNCFLEEFFILIQKLSKGINDEKKSYINEKIIFFEMKIKEYNEKAKIQENKTIESKKEDSILQQQKIQDGNNFNNEHLITEIDNPDISTIQPILNQKEEVKDQTVKVNEQNLNQSNEELQTSNQDQVNQSEITKDNITQKDNQGGRDNKNITNTKRKVNKLLIKPQLSLFFDNIDDIRAQITTLKIDYQKLENKSYQQLIEEFFNYLELNNEEAYRHKMVGFYYAFNNRDKTTRIPRVSNTSPKRQLSPKAAREMGEMLIRRKREKEEERRLKQEKEKETLFSKSKNIAKIKNEKLQINSSNKLQEKRYKQIVRSNIDYSKEKHNKISWDQLSQVDYDHFIIHQSNDKFKEVINENNIDSDDEDLLRHLNYNISANQPISHSSIKITNTYDNNSQNYRHNKEGAYKGYESNVIQNNIKNYDVSYKKIQANKQKKIVKV